MVVMPNHFHCIVENVGYTVGVDLRVCPYKTNVPISVEHVSGNPIMDEHVLNEQILGKQILSEHVGSPLHRVVQWFKTMSTNEYIRGVKQLGWQSFNGKLWQRNYWDHIIRDEQSYQRIAEYIINNPKNWDNDKFYK